MNDNAIDILDMSKKVLWKLVAFDLKRVFHFQSGNHQITKETDTKK